MGIGREEGGHSDWAGGVHGTSGCGLILFQKVFHDGKYKKMTA